MLWVDLLYVLVPDVRAVEACLAVRTCKWPLSRIYQTRGMLENTVKRWIGRSLRDLRCRMRCSFREKERPQRSQRAIGMVHGDTGVSGSTPRCMWARRSGEFAENLGKDDRPSRIFSELPTPVIILRRSAVKPWGSGRGKQE